VTASAQGPDTTLLVIAKQPVPGRVKTRLVPPFTHEQAAALAEAALADTLHITLMAPARRRLLVLDGKPGAWLPHGFDIVPQCGGTLDERLADAFAAVHGPALLIGMDTPQITPDLLTVDWQLPTPCSARPPTAGSGHLACGYRIPPCYAASPCQPRAPARSSVPGYSRPGCGSSTCPSYATWTRQWMRWRWHARHRGAVSPYVRGNSQRSCARHAA
jgi:Uncharacterized protein conserved in bacteria (DUF2064)